MTFCRDCAHIRPSEAAPNMADFSTCAASTRISLVDGREDTYYCVAARSEGGKCGPDARLFKAKSDVLEDGQARA